MRKYIRSLINENSHDIGIVFFLVLLIQVFPSGMSGGHNTIYGNTGFPFTFLVNQYHHFMGINEYTLHFSILPLLGNLIAMLLAAVAIAAILKSLFHLFGLASKRLTNAPVIYFGVAISLFFALRSWSLLLTSIEARNDVPLCYFYWGFPLRSFRFPQFAVITNLSIILFLSTLFAFVRALFTRKLENRKAETTPSGISTNETE